MAKAELIKKTKLIFSRRYGREIANQEAKEIMANLTALMEALVPKSYNGISS